jgi:protein-tyrosine phosphatase
MAYTMARQSVETGFTHVLATSHFIAGEPYGKKEDLQAAAKTMSRFMKSRGMDLHIIPAHEAYLTPELIDHVRNREVILIGNQYLLVELPMSGWQKETLALITDLTEMGVKVIVAHPERCSAIADNPDLAVELIDCGASLQLNLNSLKYLSTSAGKTARALLKYRMYHFVGSDAHSAIKRSPAVVQELKTLRSMTDDNYYSLIVRQNPERALKGLDIENHFDEHWTGFESMKAKSSLKDKFWLRLEAWRLGKR